MPSFKVSHIRELGDLRRPPLTVRVLLKYAELRYEGESSSAHRIFVGENCCETEKTGQRMHDGSAIHKLSMEIWNRRIQSKRKIKNEAKHYVSNGRGRSVKGPKP